MSSRIHTLSSEAMLIPWWRSYLHVRQTYGRRFHCGMSAVRLPYAAGASHMLCSQKLTRILRLCHFTSASARALLLIVWSQRVQRSPSEAPARLPHWNPQSLHNFIAHGGSLSRGTGTSYIRFSVMPGDFPCTLGLFSNTAREPPPKRRAESPGIVKRIVKPEPK